MDCRFRRIFAHMFRKLPRPRTFDYRPRFYDPDREHLKRGGQGDLTGMKARISRQFRDNSGSAHRNSAVKAQVRRSNLLLVTVLVMLLLGAYWFLSVHLPRIVAIVE